MHVDGAHLKPGSMRLRRKPALPVWGGLLIGVGAVVCFDAAEGGGGWCRCACGQGLRCCSRRRRGRKPAWLGCGPGWDAGLAGMRARFIAMMFGALTPGDGVQDGRSCRFSTLGCDLRPPRGRKPHPKVENQHLTPQNTPPTTPTHTKSVISTELDGHFNRTRWLRPQPEGRLSPTARHPYTHERGRPTRIRRSAPLMRTPASGRHGP